MRCPSSISSTSHHATNIIFKAAAQAPTHVPKSILLYGPPGTVLLLWPSWYSPLDAGLIAQSSWYSPPGKSVHMANIYACSRGLCGMGVLLSFQPFPYAVLLACSYIIASLSVKQQAIIWEPDF